jgi:hypothetical protein
VSVHQQTLLFAAIPSQTRLTVGAVAFTSFTRATLVEQVPAAWYKGIVLGPMVSYARDAWCLGAIAAVGYFGQRLDARAFRTYSVLLGCWAPTRTTVLRLAAGVVWRTHDGAASPLILLGWSHRGDGWTTRALLPLAFNATAWLHPRFGVGVQANGNVWAYSTSLEQAKLVRLVFPSFGPRLIYRWAAGFCVGASGGPIFDAVAATEGSHFAPARWRGQVRLDFALDEDLF